MGGTVNSKAPIQGGAHCKQWCAIASLARLREVLVDYHPPSKTLDCRLNHLLLIVLVILHPNVVVLALLDKEAHYVLFVFDDTELRPACRKRLPSWWVMRGIGS